MPNDCWNRMTFTEEDVGRFYVEEFKDVPEWAYQAAQLNHPESNT
jgi:hypothetical protein